MTAFAPHDRAKEYPTTLGVEQQKRLAAEAAAATVADGAVVGLGSGTTAMHLIEVLALRVRAGLRLTGIPSSEATAQLAGDLGIPLGNLNDFGELDLDIDGADEVDPRRNLIKGFGGALLREKLVARAARRFIVVVDERKIVTRLGLRATVPVEVLPFGWTHTRTYIERLGLQTSLRGGAEPLHTDSGNYILDCRLPELDDPATIAAQLKAISGVVEHGLFLGMASEVLIGHPDGTVSRQ